MPKINYRFTVYDRIRNTTAATWNCGIRGSDVYLFSRAIGYALKFSFHTRTGQCHVKYDPKFLEKNENILRDRYVDKWTFRKVGSSVNPLTIVTPAKAVNKPLELTGSKKINLIPAAMDGKAVFIGLFILAPETKIIGEPLISHKLPDGDKFVLASAPAEMPAIRAPKKWPVNFFEGQSSDSLEDTEHLRMMLLAGDGASRTVFDFVGGSSKDSD